MNRHVLENSVTVLYFLFSPPHSFPSLEYKKLGNLTGTVRKHTPSLEALQVLYQRMEYEYIFYNYIRDLFHLTKRKMGLHSGPRPSRHHHNPASRTHTDEQDDN